MTKIEKLEAELNKEKARLKAKTLSDIAKKTGFKIGDVVEVRDRERINDYDYVSVWTKGEISHFSSESNGSVYVQLKHNSSSFNIEKIKLFNENDYTLRHSLWDRELDIENQFQLIVDKPKSTKGELYNIFRVVKEVDCNIEYFYYNDYGHLQSLYEGEFHVTTEN